MITRILYDEEKEAYDKVVIHPIQTWAWGEFQKTQGHQVVRLGVFTNDKLISGYTISFHTIPKTNLTIGTILRGPTIDHELITNVTKVASDHNAIFVKLEPETVYRRHLSDGQVEQLNQLPEFPSLVVSPKVAFYPHTYLVDLTRPESDIMDSFHSKTRYNIKLAQKHNVEIKEMTNQAGFDIYLKLLFDTTKRQGFYLHSQKYHKTLWKILEPTGMVRILIASYQDQPLAAFMLFVQKDRLFYPYGASANHYREVMAPNLLMWDAIRLGKKLGLKTFDQWGCLGPAAKDGDQGYGFHRFKQGYGGDLVEYVGTWDLVLNPLLYQIYNMVDRYRWKLLRLKASITSRLPNIYQ